MLLQPGPYTLKGIPFDYRRTDTRVDVLARIPYEPDLYRVQLLGGGLIVASGSMLAPITYGTEE